MRAAQKKWRCNLVFAAQEDAGRAWVCVWTKAPAAWKWSSQCFKLAVFADFWRGYTGAVSEMSLIIEGEWIANKRAMF
jgi:hypothetical protein